MGPYEDIPAPDMNTDSRHMAWFFDEYSKFEGFSPGVVTGKPVWLHGSHGREAATGRGTVLGISNLLSAYKDGPNDNRIEGQKFVIQVLVFLPFLHLFCCCCPWQADFWKPGLERCCCAGLWERGCVDSASARRAWRNHRCSI